jgi:hypothetical protein
MPLSEAGRRILGAVRTEHKRSAGMGLRKTLNAKEFCCSPPEFVPIYTPCKLRKA